MAINTSGVYMSTPEKLERYPWFIRTIGELEPYPWYIFTSGKYFIFFSNFTSLIMVDTASRLSGSSLNLLQKKNHFLADR